MRAMLVYALTIFTGAFLLFQVQPLIGKYILPWFGGAPGVWTTCLLFFQMLLLGGYAYAHFTSRWLKPRRQVILHLALLAAALALAAHYAGRFLEAGRGRKPDPANPRSAAGVPGPAVFRPLGHRPPDATLVQPHASRRFPFPALRALEHRLAAGAGQLSDLFRDAFHARDAGAVVGLGTDPVCRRLRPLRPETVEGRE